MPLFSWEGIGCALLSPAPLGAGKAAAGPTGSHSWAGAPGGDLGVRGAVVS